MSWRDRLAGVDKRALALSALVAIAAFVALTLLIGRVTRLAIAQEVDASESWAAPVGRELILDGVEGRVFGFESDGGGGVSVVAGPVRLADGSQVRELVLFVSGGAPGVETDNRSGLQVGLAAPGRQGAVALRRQGDRLPRIAVRSADLPLAVEAWVVIGDSLVMPSLLIRADGRTIEAPDFSYAFTVLPGGKLSITFPAASGTPSAAVALDPGTFAQEESRLALREAAVGREGESRPSRQACGAAIDDYALWPFLRLTGSAIPTGTDCDAGHLELRALQVESDRLEAALSGTAYFFEDGKPGRSLWAALMANPLLGLAVNTALPLALTTVLGWITFRRSSRPKPASRPRKAGRRGAAPRKPRRPPVPPSEAS